jgi:hypothetical protein
MLADFYRGDHLTFSFEFAYEDGTPVDVSGGSLWFTMKELDDDSDNDDSAVIQVVTTDYSGDDSNEMEMNITKAQTDVDPKLYKWDFQFVTVTGRPTTLCDGTVRVKADVTRRWADNGVDCELFLLEMTGAA